MSTVRPLDPGAGEGTFPLVRKGYDRAAVDHFARDVQSQIGGLQHWGNTLEVENRQLRAALDEASAGPGTADFSSLGGRAQEILRIAEEQARDTTQTAYGEADALREQTQQETRKLREDTAQELAVLRRHELAELAALRRRGEEDAALQVERAKAESDQLLAAARLQAEAVRVESEAQSHGVIKAARLDALARVATAEKDAGEITRVTAERQEAIFAELQLVQQQANATVADMLAAATQQQTTSATHLSEQTEQAAAVRREALAQAEQARADAVAEAQQIIARAQQQAATIDERARQEFTWRRRQMRQEQDLLARRKQAMLSQLTSLSALAVETAGSLPEVPEMSFSDFEELPADQEPGAATAPGEEDFAAESDVAPEPELAKPAPDEQADDDATTVRSYADTRRH